MNPDLVKQMFMSMAAQYYRNLYNPRDYIECINKQREEVRQLLLDGKTEEAIKACLPNDELLCKTENNAITYILKARNSWKANYCSWSLPPRIDQLNGIRSIVQGKTILELGAGSGFWTAIMQSLGAKVIATDLNAPDYEFREEKSNDPPFYYIDVERISASKALSKYGKDADILFMCWPKWKITKTRFDLFKGKLLMVIGEAPGGTTYSGYPDTIDWTMVGNIQIPVWQTLEDSLRVYLKE